ncbi:LacI family DNA-binding transcriptional regulator [Rariglobus hedericola]|uniref:LacI family transcriptional regulator n=1 Tax=Rariglobus hedericola TaxID=2597822 RepID=A0A556QRL0_9BACT|nr:LacI family DNA-binding transcriptional regulator [Rariglobus hedericola]TSJ79276.1 LacI family transcriptional regulator [Rariglobus hedericola]
MSSNNPSTALTMSELAKVAGVSKMTVSLALRGNEKISAATRERIRALADKMGYRPNPLVQTLMANLRSSRPANYHSTIAWVTAFPTRDGWSKHWVHKLYHQGAVARAAALGYKIETFWALAPRMNGAALTRMLRARGIRGLVIPPVADPGTRLDIDWAHFSCATIGYSFTEPRLHRAAANLREGMTRALTECLQRGFKRIGFALPANTDARVNHSWLAGYLAWQQFIPAKDRLPVLLAPDRLEDLLPKWLGAHRPDVIISPNFEFLKWLPSLGKRIPEDISLVTLSYPDAEDASIAHISGINQNNVTIGEAAVDLVVSQLQHNDAGIPAHPRVMLIDGFWNEGATLATTAKEPAVRLIKPAGRKRTKNNAL